MVSTYAAGQITNISPTSDFALYLFLFLGEFKNCDLKICSPKWEVGCTCNSWILLDVSKETCRRKFL